MCAPWQRHIEHLCRLDLQNVSHQHQRGWIHVTEGLTVERRRQHEKQTEVRREASFHLPGQHLPLQLQNPASVPYNELPLFNPRHNFGGRVHVAVPAHPHVLGNQQR